jgi:hypothetical protein
MIHHHLTTAIRAAVTYYLDAANQAATLEHLYNTAHDDTTLIKIIEELREQPPKVIPHATAGAQGLPLIVCQQLSRTVTHRPLGGTALGIEQTISNQTAQIEIMAAGAEATETLSQMVVTALHALRADFISNGYLTFQFDSIAELTPQEMLAAEELGVFVRRLNISAMIHDSAGRHIFTADEVIGTLTLGLKPSGRVTPL